MWYLNIVIKSCFSLPLPRKWAQLALSFLSLYQKYLLNFLTTERIVAYINLQNTKTLTELNCSILFCVTVQALATQMSDRKLIVCINGLLSLFLYSRVLKKRSFKTFTLSMLDFVRFCVIFTFARMKRCHVPHPFATCIT